MISTKIAYAVNPLTFVENEGNLKIAYDYDKRGDAILAIQGLSQVKIGRSSTKEVLQYSKIAKDPRVIECRMDGYCVALTISSETARESGVTPESICTQLILKFANTFVRRTHGTRFYVKKYHC